MEIVMTGYQASQEIINNIEQRLSFLRKYFVIPVIKVEIDTIPFDVSLKITVRIDLGKLTLGNSIVHDDYFSGVELCLMKIEDKIKAQREALSLKYPDCIARSFPIGNRTKPIAIARKESREIREYDEEEAIMFMELNGLNFLVYQDVFSKELSAVSRDIDGNYIKFDFQQG